MSKGGTSDCFEFSTALAIRYIITCYRGRGGENAGAGAAISWGKQGFQGHQLKSNTRHLHTLRDPNVGEIGA